MAVFFKALVLVVLAEMGDKTQLLAMAMASKYKVKQVMIGVLIATVCNHAIAVAIGAYAGALIPMDMVKILAAILFLIFGLWTLRGDKLDDEENKKSKFGPIATVGIAFFIAEFGDKTQLMTITISAQSSMPVFILAGTTVGMMIADGIGIVGGAWMCKHIPEKYIKWITGGVFMFFGALTLYEAVPERLLTVPYIALFLGVAIILIYLAGFKFAYRNELCNIALKKDGEQSA